MSDNANPSSNFYCYVCKSETDEDPRRHAKIKHKCAAAAIDDFVNARSLHDLTEKFRNRYDIQKSCPFCEDLEKHIEKEHGISNFPTTTRNVSSTGLPLPMGPDDTSNAGELSPKRVKSQGCDESAKKKAKSSTSGAEVGRTLTGASGVNWRAGIASLDSSSEESGAENVAKNDRADGREIFEINQEIDENDGKEVTPPRRRGGGSRRSSSSNRGRSTRRGDRFFYRRRNRVEETDDEDS